MAGLIRTLTGGESPEQKRAKRAKRQQATADAIRSTKLAKQRGEEELVAKGRRKKKRTRTVFTSPLGLSDTGTDTLA